MNSLGLKPPAPYNRLMPVRVRFGDFIFDDERRELTRLGDAIHLSPKAFDLLAILIAHRPRALRREEIYEQLWPQTFVVPANVNNLISEVRLALGDREHSIVETKRRFGFAFTPETQAERRTSENYPPRLYRVTLGRKKFDLQQGRNLIGRDLECAVIIDSPAVSRHHAVIDVGAGEATIEDLGSKNGTFLRQARVSGAAILRDGDEIEIGRTILRVSIHDRHATTLPDPR